MNAAEKKLLIFDLDGTIADTLYSIMEAVNMCMKHYGFSEKSYEEVRDAVGNGAKNLIMRMMPKGGNIYEKNNMYDFIVFDAFVPFGVFRKR